MAADKRATRLGVLALVATMLFGALGVRLWFLQTVAGRVAPGRPSTTRSRARCCIAPERGQIFDADGRMLADNERVLTPSPSTGTSIRKASDRATLFQRLSGWLDVTVADMEARYDADTYSRFRPLPLAEDVRRGTS